MFMIFESLSLLLVPLSSPFGVLVVLLLLALDLVGVQLLLLVL